MGKAARWFKGLFGMKKGKERENRISGGYSVAGESNIPGYILPADPAWLRTYLAESEMDQSKHAIAVAAATAAAAQAAEAAAQAAVAVVRLTCNGRVGGFVAGPAAGAGRERWAAMKIQTVFRGYLARKAHRALRGVVKLQALVRGYLVRKRAALTLRCMQALFRAQTAIRSRRINRSLNNTDCSYVFHSRHSTERFDESRSEIHSKRMSISVEQHFDGNSPKIVEIDTDKTRLRSRSRAMMNVALSECGDDRDLEWSSSPLEKSKFSYSKSVVGGGCGWRTPPSYMAKTQSFKAKQRRSHSAPRQRPPEERKRLTLDEAMAPRCSVSSLPQQQLFQDSVRAF